MAAYVGQSVGARTLEMAATVQTERQGQGLKFFHSKMLKKKMFQP